MYINQLTKEADDLIRKVVSRYNHIYSHTGNFSQVELDLMLEDLRHLYDKFRQISQENLAMNRNQEVVTEPQPSPVKSASPPQPASQDHEMSHGQSRQKSETEAATPVQTSPETFPASPAEDEDTQLIENAPEPLKETRAMAETSAENLQPESPKTGVQANAQEMIADRFKAIGKSISDTVVDGTSESSLGERLKYQKLTDLKSAIGLYEKFNIINELFAGDNLAYEQAIVNLNGSSTLSEAEHCLATLKARYKWPEESEAVARLQDLLQRKFL